MPSARDSRIILVRPRGAICGHPRLVGRWPLLRYGTVQGLALSASECGRRSLRCSHRRDRRSPLAAPWSSGGGGLCASGGQCASAEASVAVEIPGEPEPVSVGRSAERDTRISPFRFPSRSAHIRPSGLTERVGKGVDRNRFLEPPCRLTEPGSVPIVGLGARASAPEKGGRPAAQSERVGHAPQRPHPDARGCLAPPPLAAHFPRYRARNP